MVKKMQNEATVSFFAGGSSAHAPLSSLLPLPFLCAVTLAAKARAATACHNNNKIRKTTKNK